MRGSNSTGYKVRTQLAGKKGQQPANRLNRLDHDLSNVLVRAQVDRTVVAMNIFTHGVIASFRVILCPARDPLVVDGQLPVHLIDKVHPTLKVELIFSASARQN
jgi:protease secretion system membrane fusion protein